MHRIQLRDGPSTREVYGKTLVEVGEKYPEIVVLDADLSKSTKTIFFKNKYPDKFFQMGISESNMIGVASGLASCGKKVFVSTFAIFGSRPWEQIRNTIARGNFSVALCFSHIGLTVGEDGASAQACEYVSIMRAIPNMSVIVPSDGIETKQVIEFLAENLQWPVFVGLTRNKVKLYHSENYKFQFGKGELVLDGDDLTFISCGQMVQQCIIASDILLERHKISAAVVNMAVVKPIDKHIIIQQAKKTKKIITVEEHTIIGGLGEAVAGVLSQNFPVPMTMIGIEDKFGESGTPEELLEKYGLDVESIVSKTLSFLERNK